MRGSVAVNRARLGTTCLPNHSHADMHNAPIKNGGLGQFIRLNTELRHKYSDNKNRGEHNHCTGLDLWTMFHRHRDIGNTGDLTDVLQIIRRSKFEI
jgi:hypothetical protein